MPQSVSSNYSHFSAATVTETAILRSKMEALEKLVAQQSEEIRQLRRHVDAFRDGARLAEEP